MKSPVADEGASDTLPEETPEESPQINVDGPLQEALAACTTAKPYPMKVIVTMNDDGSYDFALDQKAKPATAKRAKALPQPVQDYMAEM